jgi:flagellar assembly protein FliH
MDADLRTSPYAAAASYARWGVDPRLVDHRLEPAFRAALTEAAESARRAGYAEGWAAGRADGLTSTRREAEAATHAASVAEQLRCKATQQALTTLGDAAEAARVREQPTMDALEAAAVRLGLDLAELLLGRPLPGGVAAEAALRRALALAGSPGALVARLHPDDVAPLAGGSGDSRVTLVADPAVPPGGCVLEDGATRIDACLAPAIARVRSELLP